MADSMAAEGNSLDGDGCLTLGVCRKCKAATVRQPPRATILSKLCSECRCKFTFVNGMSIEYSHNYVMYRKLQYIKDNTYVETDLSEKFILDWIDGLNQY